MMLRARLPGSRPLIEPLLGDTLKAPRDWIEGLT